MRYLKIMDIIHHSFLQNLIKIKTKIKKTENVFNDIISFEEQAFNEFWSIYPKKVNKKGCFKSFKNIKNLKTELPLILNAVENFKNSKEWKKQNGQFIPYPQTFINQERWKDAKETTRTDVMKNMGYDMDNWTTL